MEKRCFVLNLVFFTIHSTNLIPIHLFYQCFHMWWISDVWQILYFLLYIFLAAYLGLFVFSQKNLKSYGRILTQFPGNLDNNNFQFLNSVHLYINQKNTLATTLFLMLLLFGMICLMRFHSAPTLTCFRKRVKIVSLQKGIQFRHTLSPASPWYWTWQWLWIDDFLKLDWVLCLRLCLAEIKRYKSAE